MASFGTNARWTDQFLDDMRQAGDASADAAIRLWKTSVPDVSVSQLAGRLVGFEGAQEVDTLIALLSKLPGMSEAIDPRLRTEACECTDHELSAGHELFREHGLKILMILVFYSLPSAYAAQSGVRVLHSRHGSTGFFVKDLNRRLIETTQFVIDVLTPSSLDIVREGSTHNHGLAVRSALRVRLLHGAVRSLIEAHKTPAWDARTLGKPVNQEDMAGTLLTFSWIVIDGLRRLGIDMSYDTAEAYFGIWKKVGALLGVNLQLIPPDLRQAELLMQQIKKRQIDQPIVHGIRNDDGIEMTARLLEFTRAALPAPLRWRRLPASVMRFFLPPEVATSLGVPRTPILDWFVKVWFHIEARVTKFRFYDALNRLVFREWGARDSRARSLFQFSRFFNKRLVHHIQCFDRNRPLEDGRRPPNVELHGWEDRWALDQADFVTRGIRELRRRAKQLVRRKRA